METVQDAYKDLLGNLRSYLRELREEHAFVYSDAMTAEFLRQVSPPPQRSQAKAAPPQSKTTPAPKRPASPGPRPPVREQQRRRPVAPSADPIKPEAAKKPDVPRPQLEQAKLESDTDYAPIRAILAKACPNLRLIEVPPDDARAREVATRWQRKAEAPQVIVLADSKNPAALALLRNLATAINLQFAPARMVETRLIDQQLAWERFLESKDVRVVLCRQALLEEHAVLQSAYADEKLRERIAVIPIEAAERYLNDPQLKASLWQSLKQTLPIYLDNSTTS